MECKLQESFEKDVPVGEPKKEEGSRRLGGRARESEIGSSGFYVSWSFTLFCTRLAPGPISHVDEERTRQTTGDLNPAQACEEV